MRTENLRVWDTFWQVTNGLQSHQYWINHQFTKSGIRNEERDEGRERSMTPCTELKMKETNRSPRWRHPDSSWVICNKLFMKSVATLHNSIIIIHFLPPWHSAVITCCCRLPRVTEAWPRPLTLFLVINEMLLLSRIIYWGQLGRVWRAVNPGDNGDNLTWKENIYNTLSVQCVQAGQVTAIPRQSDPDGGKLQQPLVISSRCNL